MATIKTHHSSASQLFKRLSSYAKDHPLYKALKEFGRIIKTQFILTYFDNVELRQQIQKQLSRVEQANKFSHAVFFDNDQAFQTGGRDDQELVNGCKLLLQNPTRKRYTMPWVFLLAREDRKNPNLSLDQKANL